MTMMLIRRIFLLVSLFACISTAFAVGIKQQHGLVGGYAPADVNDPFVEMVAKFALESLEKNKKQYTFLASVPSDTHLEGTVLQAQQQVVAGRNYKLIMTVSDSTGCLGAFQVTIYDHFGDLSITSFGNEMTCIQAKEELTQDNASDSDEGS